MIRTMLYDKKTGKSKYGDEGLFAEWANDPSQWIWVDFEDEEPTREKEFFLETFGLHPLAISDAHRERHPPKLETFDNYLFLLVNGLDSATTELEFQTISIAFFISERFMLSRRKYKSLSIDGVWAEAENNKLDVARGSTHITYHILRRVTDRYTKLVEGLQERLDAMEDEMFVNPRDSLLEEILGYSRNLKRLRRIFNYHQDLFARLTRKGHPLFGKPERHEFTDIFEHTERLSSLTNLYKELADDLMNGYISVTSHRLNQIMKVLTIVTVIFLPLTLMVGIYGMNFDYMPELKIHSAYFILLSTMGVIVIALLLLFRKMKWL